MESRSKMVSASEVKAMIWATGWKKIAVDRCQVFRE